MEDVWQQMNPQVFQFTFHTKLPKETYARLDYVLVNQAVTSQCTEVQILPAYKTDHSSVIVEFNSVHKSRKKGLWKLNNSLLKDESYNMLIEYEIAKTQAKCAASLCQEDCTWENVKSTIEKVSRKYSKEQSDRLNKDFAFMKARLLKLSAAYYSCNDEKERVICDMQVQECQKYVERYIAYKMEGAKVHSRERWYTFGEKCNAYYLGLEKVRSGNKTVSRLMRKDKTITKNQAEILREEYKYYKQLYTKNPAIFFSIVNDTEIMLTEKQKKGSEEEFTFQQFTDAMRSMANSQSPGIDGITVEFYKKLNYYAKRCYVLIVKVDSSSLPEEE